MINKLISKSEVRLIEWDGIRSNDYVDGFCDAIQKVIDLEPIPTLGVDEVEKIKAEIEKKCDRINSIASVLRYPQHREIQELLCGILASVGGESEDA